MDNELDGMIKDIGTVFIFTKDRPTSLKQTLNSLRGEQVEISLIDDSFLLRNQLENQSIANSFYNITYFGKKEFNIFFKSNNLIQSNRDFQIDELGSQNWNLGSARNFALILAKYFRIEKALFMDDDIIVDNRTLISNSFNLLKDYFFVGAKITGMPDHSIVGHISNKLEIDNTSERMLSGGFLFFNPQKIDIQFTNVYNEDWIWMLLQLQENDFLEFGEVKQEKFDPFYNYKTKIVFQEFGEIVIKGLFKLRKIKNTTALSDKFFWENVINERKEYLKMLIEISRIKNKESFIEMCTWLEGNLRILNRDLFKNYFELFFEQNNEFRHLVMKVPKVMPCPIYESF